MTCIDKREQSEMGDDQLMTASARQVQMTLTSMKLVIGDSERVFWRKGEEVPKGTFCVKSDKAILLFEVSATGPGTWETSVAIRNELFCKVVSIDIKTDTPKTCWVWLDEPFLIPDGKKETLFDYLIGETTVASASVITTKSPGSSTTDGPMITTDTLRDTNVAIGESQSHKERSLESNGSANPILLTPAVVRPFGCRAEFQRGVSGPFLPLADGTTITLWYEAFLNLRMNMPTVATKSYRLTISCQELDIRAEKDFKGRVNSQSRAISKYYWMKKKRPVGVYPASFIVRSGFDREEVSFFISLIDRPDNATDITITSRSNAVESADPNEGDLYAGLPRISTPTPDPRPPLIDALLFKRLATDDYSIFEKGITVSAGATLYIGAHLLTAGQQYNMTFVCDKLGIEAAIKNAKVSGESLYRGIGRKIGIPSKATPGVYKMKLSVADSTGRSEQRCFELDVFPPRR